jgi:hypothetical protein
LGGRISALILAVGFRYAPFIPHVTFFDYFRPLVHVTNLIDPVLPGNACRGARIERRAVGRI